MDKCHQHLCSLPAQHDITCERCIEGFCCTEHLTFHVRDGHQDRGLVTRGKLTPPPLEK